MPPWLTMTDEVPELFAQRTFNGERLQVRFKRGGRAELVYESFDRDVPLLSYAQGSLMEMLELWRYIVRLMLVTQRPPSQDPLRETLNNAKRQ